MSECKDICRESIEKSLELPFKALFFLSAITLGGVIVAWIFSELGITKPCWDDYFAVVIMLFLWCTVLAVIKYMIPETCSKVCGKGSVEDS